MNRKYSATLEAMGGKKPYIWSMIDGSLPHGLEFDAATGRVVGTPTETGTFALTFEVTDPLGGSTPKSLTLTVK